MVPHRPTPGNDSLQQSKALASGRAQATSSPAIAAALQALLGFDVDQWTEHGLVRVKQRTVRSVFRGELDGICVHVKVFRADTFADRVRDLVRRDRGAAEAMNLRQVRERNLPAVEPLAHGFVREGERLRSFVVTRTIDGDPFSWHVAGATRRAVGTLMRRLHEAGVRPGDLHPGNVLVDRHGVPWLLDLTSVRHGGDPNLDARASDLAFFCQALDGGALDPEARDLLAGYLDGAPLPPTLRDELVLATRRWRAGALPAFGRRATRACRHTEVGARRRGQPQWHWHLPEDGAATREACEAFAASPPPPDKTGRRGAVWLRPEFVMKEREAAKARQLWRASYWLLFAGVAAAAPVALRLHRGRGLVFTRRLPAPSLAAELATGALPDAALPVIARDLGTQVGRLHAHGLGNRDLKFDNLVRDPRSGAVCMVDLDGVRRRAAGDSRGRGADLGRLLAAFRGAGEPGGAATVRAFLRGWLRAQRRLRMAPPVRRLLRRAELRAGEWASAHR